MIDFDKKLTKIENPFTNSPGYFCFACSPQNDHGLHMSFYEDEDSVYCKWKPKEYFQGYKNIIHGGIQATLVDEVAGWFIMHKLKTAGLTKNLNVSYISKIFTNQGNVFLKASLLEKEKKNAVILVELSNSDGKICTRATVEFFILPSKIAAKKVFPLNK